jgi:hypothetical protein
VLLKPGFARQKVSFPYGVAREPNYNILLEWMAYYSRYTTRKKGVMLGFSMLQLVTFNPEASDIPEAQPTQPLPCSFHVSTTRHDFAFVYSAPIKYVSTSNHHHGTSLEFVKIPPLFLHVLDAGTDSHVPFTFFWSILCMALLTMH